MEVSRNKNPLFYQTSSVIPFVARAEGIFIWDRGGKEYIDGSSGAIICNIGHGDQAVLEAVNRQARSTFFTYRTQFENQPAVELAQDLVAHSAPHLDRVFYVSGGSEAVESAMKFCRTYHLSRGDEGRYIFISRSPSYHGSTLGALGLTSYAPLEIHYRPMINCSPKIPAPYCYRCHYGLSYPSCSLTCADALETMIREIGPRNVAAFVAEPIGGASTGAVVPPDDYFATIRKICDKYGVLLILDEVMTGFGRTGKLFAYQHWNLDADIVALSKGMASGYFPLGAVMCRGDMVDSVLAAGGFPHGHTYAGNPMACAVGHAVLRRIIGDGLSDNAAAMGDYLLQGLRKLAQSYPIIGEVRGRGLLTALEFVSDRARRTPFADHLQVGSLVTARAFANGLIVYPRRPMNGLDGDHILIAPPLIIEQQQVDDLLDRLAASLAEVSARLGGT